MNTKDIEEAATSAVREAILKTGYLEQYISDNNTTPIWDGSVFIYNNKQRKKESIRGKVDVQIKGKHVEDLSAKHIKYPIEKVDLEGFQKGGGVIFFVVYINSSFDKKIYYVELTPLAILSHLKSMREAKSKSIDFEELPQNSNRVASIFATFRENCEKQRSFTEENIISFEEVVANKGITKITSSFIKYGNESDPETMLLTGELCLYAIKEGSNLQIPINLPKGKLFISSKKNVQVAINGNVYYDDIKEVKAKDQSFVQIGKSFRLYLSDVSPSAFKVLLTSCDNLDDLIRDMHFLIDIIHHRMFEINGETISLTIKADQEFKDSLCKLEEDLDAAKKIKALFDKLNIHKKFNALTATKQDNEFLYDLYSGLFERKLIKHWEKGLPNIVSLTIQNINILFAVKKVDDEDGYMIYDLFDSPIYVGYGEKFNEFLSPIYSALDSNQIATADNLVCSCVCDKYKEVSKLNPLLYRQAIEDMLRFVEAYDISKKEGLLLAARQLNEWIGTFENECETAIWKLNQLQIIKRTRALNKEEKFLLHDIIEENNDEEIKVGAYLLLEDTIAVQYHFEKLSEERQEAFKKYPIYYFMTK